MQKFISFKNVEDLERKLEYLKNITNCNKKAITEILIIKNIPFQEIEEGIGVDLSSVPPEIVKEYMETFGEMNALTIDSFENLGVVHVSDPSILETDIKLAIKFNLKTRDN